MAELHRKSRTIAFGKVARRFFNRIRIQWLWIVRRRPLDRVLFVISEPRSGSTLLSDLLNSAPGVTMLASEPLSFRGNDGLHPRRSSKRVALAHIRNSLNALEGGVRGAKLLIFQLRQHGLTVRDLVDNFPGAKFILLYRRALLEQYVSFEVAKLTGAWIGRGGDKRHFSGQIRIDRDSLNRFVADQRAKYADLMAQSWLSERAVLLSYEDLAADPQAVFERDVFPLLDLPPAPVRTGMSKQNRRSLEEVVINYEELRADLSQFELALRWSESADAVPSDSAVVPSLASILPEASV